MVEVAIKIARIGLRKSREFIRRANCVWGTLVWCFFSGKKGGSGNWFALMAELT